MRPVARIPSPLRSRNRLPSALIALAAAVAIDAAGCSREKAQPTNEGAPAASGSATPPSKRAPQGPAEERRDPTEKPPTGYRRMTVGGLAPSGEGSAVVLLDDSARRGLVIFVGGTEALSIALRLENRRYDRPLTHDLLDSAVKKLGGDVVSVRVDRFEDDVFYGSVLVAKEGRLLELDARPSDALALAIGNSAPLFVAESVLSQVGIDVEKFDFRKLEEAPSKEGARKPKGEVEL